MLAGSISALSSLDSAAFSVTSALSVTVLAALAVAVEGATLLRLIGWPDLSPILGLGSRFGVVSASASTGSTSLAVSSTFA